MMSKLILIVVLSTLINLCFSYNTTLALQLGYMCKITDESNDAISSWSCQDCSKYPLHSASAFENSSWSIRGFTGYSPSLKSVVISFRGSRDINNWILNIDTIRTNYPGCDGCSVHLGFNTGYKTVADKIKSSVKDLFAKYSTNKIIVTGHSLGGALATLAAADLYLIYGKVDQVYTFGQPRVGNQAFASYFQQWIPNNYRIVDYGDTVVHVPPMAFGFRHSNHQVWYQRGMQSYSICGAESKQCANSLSSLKYSTSDHSLQNYLKLKQQFTLFDKYKDFIYKINLKIGKPIRVDKQLMDQELKGVIKIQKELSNKVINQ